mgnify:CR=1 FL=1|jgi:hypothetical protein
MPTNYRNPPRGISNQSAMRVLLALALLVSHVAQAESEPATGSQEPSWELALHRADDGFQWTVYEEAQPIPGRPAFRVEARFDVPPGIAADTLMASMSEETTTTSGERRRLLERTPDGALVHTYIDLPFMFSDRELAIRIRHVADRETGIHRISWRDANEHLSPPDDGVLRLTTEGYWEFRPLAPHGTQAVYMTRAEIGGSLPKAVGDRLMRGQAVDSVKRLRRLLAERQTMNVAAPPPEGLAPQSSEAR